jgi:anti-anti-sigma regulatory factor
MTTPPAFDAVVDPARNLVRTRFAGNFTAAAMQAVALKVEALLSQLKPGFSVFADFSQVTAMDLDCARPLAHIMDLCRAHEVGLIVRMLPARDRDIGINLLSIVHYRGQVTTVTVDTLAEAERALG